MNKILSVCKKFNPIQLNGYDLDTIISIGWIILSLKKIKIYSNTPYT